MRRDRKSVVGSRGNLRHFISSLMSPQSFQPSHCSSFPMQMPELQANMLGQAAYRTDKRGKEQKNRENDDDDKLSESN